MSKILVPPKNNWFYELAVVASYSEKELEKTFLQITDAIFPGYFVSQFNFTFEGFDVDTGKKPDALMIRKDYSEWWIVEIETSEDRFAHVESQVKVFSKPIFEVNLLLDYTIKTFKENKTNLDKAKTKELFENVAPKALVIVDYIKPSWANSLKSFAQICELQLYMDSEGNSAYKLRGEYPI
ncbi:MAG: hypothetical protein KDC90_17380, partial [Ignavibacteriae bacterium]|nr:hypothetical protein [Ignavibacteriota bacterium]